MGHFGKGVVSEQKLVGVEDDGTAAKTFFLENKTLVQVIAAIKG